MNLSALLYTLSSVPILASRPFLAAFGTAVLARWGTRLPFLGENSILVALGNSPEWFRSLLALAILGVLATLELLSARSTTARQVLEQVDGIVKAGMAMLVAFALVDAETAGALGAIQQSGGSVAAAWALVIGGATWLAAGLRRRAVELVHAVDEGDDLGLQSLLAWAENSWAVLGLMFLVLFPFAALVLAGLTLFGIWWVRRRAEEREERAKVPCVACGAPLRPHASACHVCQREVEAPRAVGIFGQPQERATDDRARHAFDLVARKRCPRCAARLPKRAVRQACGTCERVTFASPAQFEHYLDAIAARLPRTLLIAFALGAIPILGVIPGVVYYRLNLVGGLRGYVPPLRGCLTRWVVRGIHFAAVFLQPIPVLGALVLPLLCLFTYLVYRRSLAGLARGELVAAAAGA